MASVLISAVGKVQAYPLSRVWATTRWVCLTQRLRLFSVAHGLDTHRYFRSGGWVGSILTVTSLFLPLQVTKRVSRNDIPCMAPIVGPSEAHAELDGSLSLIPILWPGGGASRSSSLWLRAGGAEHCKSHQHRGTAAAAATEQLVLLILYWSLVWYLDKVILYLAHLGRGLLLGPPE